MYRILKLDKKLNVQLDRGLFYSASNPLNHYIQKQVSQDIKRHIANCFVAITSENTLAGYYTLSAYSVSLFDLPEHLQKKLPRYPSVPVALLGRLAIDQHHTGKGLGSALLADALKRVLGSDIACYALLVDAKDDTAKAFYQHFGFLAFEDEPHKLFLPLVNIDLSQL